MSQSDQSENVSVVPDTSDALFLCGETFVQIRRLTRLVSHQSASIGVFSKFTEQGRRKVDSLNRVTRLIHDLADAAHNLPDNVNKGMHRKQETGVFMFGGHFPHYVTGEMARLSRLLDEAREIRGQ